jgi:hypothetical protein
MEARDAIERMAKGCSGCLQIMAGLEIEPEFGLDSEETPQPQCGVRAYSKLLPRDALDARARHAASFGYRVRRQSHRLKKFLAQHFARMQRRQAGHDNELL